MIYLKKTTMKKTKFTIYQILFAIRQSEAGFSDP